jgi:hypothetical protein
MTRLLLAHTGCAQAAGVAKKHSMAQAPVAMSFSAVRREKQAGRGMAGIQQGIGTKSNFISAGQ